MNDKRILLIHPSNKVLGKKDNLYTNESLTPSLGLGYLAAYCKKKGLESKIIDLRLKHRDANDVITSIRELNPVLLGIGAFTNEASAAGRIAEDIKKHFPNLPIVLGGPHASSMPVGALKESGSVDVACIGEGEETLVNLADFFSGHTGSLENIKGIAFRKNGNIILNSSRTAIDNINDLPFPAWDLFELDYYNKILMISTSRGCPYPCYFCNPDYLGKEIRTRNYKQIVDEIDRNARDYNIRHFQFADATLSLLGDEIYKLCDEIKKRNLHKEIIWDCETRADSLNLKLLRKMKEAGCRWIALGAETGNESILKDIVKKGESKQQIKEAVGLIKKAGIKVRCFFILGHYGETQYTIKETINFARELNPHALSFGLIVPNPGTPVREMAERGAGGMRILNNHWESYNQFNYDCFELENMPLSELKKWQSKAYFNFYRLHPFKALGLFINNSGYNYNLKALLKIPPTLLKRRIT